jgi:hypothetical protein
MSKKTKSEEQQQQLEGYYQPAEAPTKEPAEGSNGAASKPLLEAKSAKFRRLRDHRMPAALKRIRALQNLASRAQYDFSGEEAAEIVMDLRLAVDEVAKAFAGNALRAEGWKSKVS